jgi:hypothetical protein
VLKIWRKLDFRDRYELQSWVTQPVDEEITDDFPQQLVCPFNASKVRHL